MYKLSVSFVIHVDFFNEIQFIFVSLQLFLCDTLRVLVCHLPKKGEIIKLHSMLLTISPFMFEMILKLSLNLFFPYLFWLSNGISGLLKANA